MIEHTPKKFRKKTRVLIDLGLLSNGIIKHLIVKD